MPDIIKESAANARPKAALVRAQAQLGLDYFTQDSMNEKAGSHRTVKTV
jgi:hypothetical protein